MTETRAIHPRGGVQRPAICAVCYRVLERASTGRVRLTCSDRCRQIKKRRKTNSEFQIKLRKAARQISRWEKRLGMDFSTIPAYRQDGGAMSLRERLMVYLPRGWQVEECLECERPYIPDGSRSGTCSDSCYRTRNDYFRKLKESFYSNPRPMPAEIYPYIRAEKRLGFCAHCGDPFVPKDVRRKYCSERCKDAAYWKRRPSRRCKRCGKGYRGNRAGCSYACGLALYRLVRLTCMRCSKVVQQGSEVLPNAGGSSAPRKHKQARVFCSVECRDNLTKIKWVPKEKRCERCGEGFTATTPASDTVQRFCSGRCKERHRQHRNYAKIREARQPRPCRFCGNAIPEERKRSPFCSVGCKADAILERLDRKQLRRMQRMADQRVEDVPPEVDQGGEWEQFAMMDRETARRLMVAESRREAVGDYSGYEW